MRGIQLVSVLLAAAFVAACSQESSNNGTLAATASPYALKADPAGGMPVAAARAAGPKTGVVVVGRVRELVAGFAAFTLIDTSLTYCGQGNATKDSCEKPWDYCCHDDHEIASNLMSVVVKGKDGGVAAIERLPELRNLDLVAVKGDLVKDKDGNVSLEATGWFRRERPTLPNGLAWPQ